MISESSRDYALSHLQYSKTMQTNHNFRIRNISVHSPGDSEKMPEDVFIDWRFKLVESKNIGRTLNLCFGLCCVWPVGTYVAEGLPQNTKLQLSINIPGTGSRYLKVYGALPDDSLLKDVPYARSLLFQKIPTWIPLVQILPFLKKIPEGARPGQTKQIDREKMTNIRFPASWLKWINSQTTEIIWSFKAWLPKHVRQGSDSMG